MPLLVLLAGPVLVAAAILLAPPALRQDLADLIAPSQPAEVAVPAEGPPATAALPADQTAPAVHRPGARPSPGEAPGLPEAVVLAVPEGEASAPSGLASTPAPRLTADPPLWPVPSLPSAGVVSGRAGSSPEIPVLAAIAPPDAARALPEGLASVPPGPRLAAAVPGLQDPGSPLPLPPLAVAAPPMRPEAVALATPGADAPIPEALSATPPGLPEPEAPAAAVSRVMVHYPRGSEDRAEATAARLDAAGLDTALIATGFAVSQTNVRYYHSVDADAARLIAESVAGTEDGIVPARDFTGFRPSPEVGMVEVWLAGVPASTPAAPPARAAPAPPVAEARPAAPVPPVVSAAERAARTAIERQLLLDEVERQLAEQLRQLQRR